MMKIAIGADHAGFDLKEAIKQQLNAEGYQVTDHGTFNHDSVDFPDYALPVAEDVSQGKADRGIVVCGNGLGMSYTANKVPGVRAALVNNLILAVESRKHGNANVLSLGGRPDTGGIETPLALTIVETWLKTDFEGGRHAIRLEKIEKIDEKYRKI